MSFIELKLLGKNLCPVMLVDKASTAEFSIKSMTKHFLKSFLVMVVTISVRITHATNIEHRIERVQHLINSNNNNGEKTGKKLVMSFVFEENE